MSRRYFALTFLFLTCMLIRPTAAQQSNLLPEGGFENADGASAPGWKAFEVGFTADHEISHHGSISVRCANPLVTGARGIYTSLELNQSAPNPIRITGWSKALQVSGSRNSDYSLYVDAQYQDGSDLYGVSASFSVGTHDWERRQLMVLPMKPLRRLTLYLLFRNHSGVVWFDDIEASELKGTRLFDSQAHVNMPRRAATSSLAHRLKTQDGLELGLSARGEILSLHAGSTALTSRSFGGFMLRDVKEDGDLIPVRGQVSVRSGGVVIGAKPAGMRLSFNAHLTRHAGALDVDGEITDLSKKDRSISIYLALPVEATGWLWGRDIRSEERIASGREFTSQTRVNVGATGGLSLYPFGAIHSDHQLLGIASQMEWPSVYRIFYNGSTRQFVIAWDVALTGKTAAWPSHNARFRCILFHIGGTKASWGFRAAADRFYQLNSTVLSRKAKAEGIWMPFTSPQYVKDSADFGFAYHEGDNSVKSDDSLGILSFRYTEPMSYWMPMPPAMPRTYEAAINHLKELAGKPYVANSIDAKIQEEQEARANAIATLNCCTQDPTGHYNLEFRNEPWCDGAVFVLNPNPELPSTEKSPTKASISYSMGYAMKRYGKAASEKDGELDGEYLDSLEMVADTLDSRPSNIQAIPYPIPFDADSLEPVVPQWYATHTFARFLRDDLHNRGKLLFANSTPIRFSIFAALLDVMGIEVNWMDGNGSWNPESDEIMSYRRTMCWQKPYLLLQNTDFNRFNNDYVRRYFERSLFYAIYPSMFSYNAANNPYWENPAWYNRDRGLFKKYIPLIKQLSQAGWQPVTYARASSNIYMERYGLRLFTVLNYGKSAADTNIRIDLKSLGVFGSPTVEDRISGRKFPAHREGDSLIVPVKLSSEEVLMLELKP